MKLPNIAFDNFCMKHCCRESCKERSDYCPIADKVRERYGVITGRKCESVYYETYGFSTTRK